MSIRSVTRSLVGGAVVLGSLTGVASAASAGAKVVNLTMWQQWGGGHEEAALDKVIKEYEALNPGVRITETPVTNSANPHCDQRRDTARHRRPGYFARSRGMGEPRSAPSHGPVHILVSPEHWRLRARRPRRVDGQWPALRLAVYGLRRRSVVQQDTLQGAGLNPNDPPTTTQQLQSDAFKLTKQEGNGRITQLGFLPDFPGQSNGHVCTLEDMGWDFGGQWYNEKTHTITAGAPQNIAALNYEVSFYKKYGASNMANFESSAGAYLTANDPFESGKLAMVYDGPWAPRYIEANRPSLASEIGVAPFPAPAGHELAPGHDVHRHQSSGRPPGRVRPIGRVRFIKWETTSPQVTATFAQLVANLPQLKKVPSFPLATTPAFRCSSTRPIPRMPMFGLSCLTPRNMGCACAKLSNRPCSAPPLRPRR